MPKQTKTQPSVNGMDLEAISQTSQRSLTAMAHLHSRAFRDAMKFNAELLDFTRRRVGANIETSDRLSRCETVTEAVDVVTGFCQGAVQDYSEESAALFRIGTEIATRNSEEALAEATAAGNGPGNVTG